MKLAPIWDPDARKPGPEPVHVDLFPLFLGGTLLWAVLAVVFYALYRSGDMSSSREYVTCIIGATMGLCLLVWEHVERPVYLLLGEKDDDDTADDSAVGESGEVADDGSAACTRHLYETAGKEGRNEEEPSGKQCRET